MPAPDLYLAACAGLGADPARSVAFEDSRTGVTSANAAGMFVVGVPSLPGVVLEVHEPFAALTDPVLTASVPPVPPTGAPFTEDELAELAQLCAELSGKASANGRTVTMRYEAIEERVAVAGVTAVRD